MQLTTYRINYSEVYKKNCCFTTPPALRQVFLKDISEVAVVHYGMGESWTKQLLNFVMFVLLPLEGAAGSSSATSGSSTSSLSTGRWW